MNRMDFNSSNEFAHITVEQFNSIYFADVLRFLCYSFLFNKVNKFCIDLAVRSFNKLINLLQNDINFPYEILTWTGDFSVVLRSTHKRGISFHIFMNGNVTNYFNYLHACLTFNNSLNWLYLNYYSVNFA